jgi:hypothetical protein
VLCAREPAFLTGATLLPLYLLSSSAFFLTNTQYSLGIHESKNLPAGAGLGRTFFRG